MRKQVVDGESMDREILTQPLYGVPADDDYDETNSVENNTVEEENTIENSTKETTKKNKNAKARNETSKSRETQALYGPPPERNNQSHSSLEIPEPLYGPPPDDNKYTTGLNITNIAVVGLLFIIGLAAMLNRKLSKRAKIITAIIVVLAMIAITVFVIGIKKNINY